MVFFAAAVIKAASVLKKEQKKNRIRNAVISAPGSASNFDSSTNTITPDWWGGNDGSYAEPPSQLTTNPTTEPVSSVPSDSHPIALPLPLSTSTDGNSEEEQASAECVVVNETVSKEHVSNDAAKVSHAKPVSAPAGSFLAEMQRPNSVAGETGSPSSVASVPRSATFTKSSSNSGKREKSSTPPKGSFAAVVDTMHAVRPLKESARHRSRVRNPPGGQGVATVSGGSVHASGTSSSGDTTSRTASRRNSTIPPKDSFAAIAGAIYAAQQLKESTGSRSHMRSAPPRQGIVAAVGGSGQASGPISPEVSTAAAFDRRVSKPTEGSFLEAASTGEKRVTQTGNSASAMVRKASKHSWEAHTAASRK